MYEFKAVLNDDQTITITTNTYWSCKAEGNFKLSAYDGTESTTLFIEIPKDVRIAMGEIFFSYGDERCDYPTIYVYTDNMCYIESYPSFNECKVGEVEEKTIYFFYEEPQETFNVSIDCFSNWTVETNDFDYITSNNEVMIIASGYDGELLIVPDNNCGGRSIIHVKLVKKNTYVPPTPPPPTPPVVTIKVSGVKLSKKTLSLKPNESQKLIATVSPANATNKRVVWSSSDDSVAVVNQQGIVIAKSTGDCIITVTTVDGGFADQCSVTVASTPLPPQAKNYLTFVAVNSGTFTFKSNTDGRISYSVDDGQTWTQLENDANTPEVSVGSKIMWKGNLNPHTSGFPYGIGHFDSSNVFNVEGNILSLLYGDDFESETDCGGKMYTFHHLFSGCTGLASAENLSLVSDKIEYCGYEYMFLLCTNLTIAPQLPATTLDTGCYAHMFQGCRKLVIAPSLPAIRLKNDCYRSMFKECTSLTSAPVLSVANLSNVYGCYQEMFYNCTSLKNIKCLATNLGGIDSHGNTYGWVDLIANGGTFTKAARMTDWPTGPNGIPEGWTVVDA